MNPISVALRGKGLPNLARRTARIINSYGITPARMDRSLKQFIAALNEFECSATFPITAVALGRNPQLIRKYHEQGIEFAIHGYRHIDHCQLSRVEQQAQLKLARQLFEQAGIPTQGFRGPYLHWSKDTLAALQQLDLVYDSSQGLDWGVWDGHEIPAYEHVLNFYGALPADDYPSLPSLEEGLVRIPYSLPDDEALVERLDLKTQAEMTALWLAILRRTHELGELFTLGLHPERTTLCLEPLRAVLAEARSLRPPVWIACLDEIAAWWRARSEATLEMEDRTSARIDCGVSAPEGTTVLARAVEVEAPTRPWASHYKVVLATVFTIRARSRPWIGLAPTASSKLAQFLRQQGYIVETALEPGRHSYYFDQTEFAAGDKRSVLARIEETGYPLLRLGRWPDGARSALAVSGDIDALTLWDFVLRFFER